MNRREHYRIIYPLKCRAKLTILDKEYEVIDISENGIRFFSKTLHEFKAGREIKLKITFDDEESLDLEGKILRVDKRFIIIHLSENIPFGRIIQEQRYIRGKYPSYFEE